jgi:curved DNA-binding protein CbpA
MSSKARGFDPEAWGRGKTPYEILGCAKSASAKELKLAYYKAAKLHHPDANPGDAEGAKARFQYVSAAYELLSDDRKRKEYDAGASAWGTNTSSRGGGGAGSYYNRQQSGAARDWKARQEQANNTTSGYNQQWYRQTNSYNSYGASSDMFNFITTEDVDVLKEAFADYETELKEDVEYAMDCVHHGEYKEALSVVSQYVSVLCSSFLPSFSCL